MKISVSIPDHVLENLEARRPDLERSTAISADLELLSATLAVGLAEARKSLSPGEALAILDVTNGIAWEGASLTPWLQSRALAQEVDDAIILNGLADKWGVDGRVLTGKLSALSPVAHLALLDWVRTMWASIGMMDFGSVCESLFKGE